MEDLNRQLHFYRQVIAPEDLKNNALAIFSLELESVLADGGQPIEIIVRKSMREQTYVKGEVLVQAEGTINGEDILYKDGLVEALPFTFRYFQRLDGVLQFPEDFNPDTIHVILQVDGEEKLRKSYSWKKLLVQRDLSHSIGEL